LDLQIYTVEKLYKDRKDFLELILLSREDGLKRKILTNEIHRPGLALSGFLERFPNKRTQILGETEIAYLRNQEPQARRMILERMFKLEIPCVIVTKSINPPPELLEIANSRNISVFQSLLSTTELMHRLAVVLDNVFALQTTLHGTLVDVYGVGLLYTGKSGIGKSECALDLVERGHRLVADDVIRVIKKAPDVVVGTGSELLGHCMEVRGIGIIDIEKLFGIRAIRLQKRIEVEVRLVFWDNESEYERLGLDDKFTAILGVEIPIVVIPVSPGKNITVISEVIAMNHMLKTYGQDSAQEISRRLSEEIYRRKTTYEYLESDIE
jgi:HPr kinase/phosphorylase